MEAIKDKMEEKMKYCEYRKFRGLWLYGLLMLVWGGGCFILDFPFNMLSLALLISVVSVVITKGSFFPALCSVTLCMLYLIYIVFLAGDSLVARGPVYAISILVAYTIIALILVGLQQFLCSRRIRKSATEEG